MADVQTVTVTLSDGTPVQVVAGTPLHELYLALAGFTTTAGAGLPDIDLRTVRPMAWFMTPHGPQSVIEPATIAEFRRRDYAEITAQQAADFFANAVEIPDVSFITGQELPGAMAAAAADDDSPFAVTQRAASVAAVKDAITDGDIQVGSPDAATIEELFASALYNGTLVSGVYPVLIAPFALKVTSLSLAYLNGTSPIPSEDLNYWTIGFNRYRANTEVVIAAKGTRNNSSLNEAWPRRTDWNLDLTTFTEANATCQKGDIIAVRFTKTGTIIDPIDVMMTVRYVPL